MIYITDNAECPSNKVCHKFRCINPCSTSCGVDAECNVRNHVTVCQCPRGFIGDPFVSCTPSASSNVVSRQSNLLAIALLNYQLGIEL